MQYLPGDLLREGIKGTNSYGAGLCRHLRARNIEVVEVIRPAKVMRRMQGKSHAIDACTVTHTALADQDVVMPKTSIGTVEASRVAQTNAALTAVKGTSTVIASQLLIAAGDNPERLHSESAFAAFRGVSPLPASSGQTTRVRLNRGGDRAANSAL